MKDTVFQLPHHGSPHLEDSITSDMDLSATLAIVVSGPRMPNALNHFHPSCAAIATVTQRVAQQREIRAWKRAAVAAGGAPLVGCVDIHAMPLMATDITPLVSWSPLPWNILVDAEGNTLRLLQTSARGRLPNMILTVIAVNGAPLPTPTEAEEDAFVAAFASEASAGGGVAAPAAVAAPKKQRTKKTARAVSDADKCTGADALCGFEVLPSVRRDREAPSAADASAPLCFGLFIRRTSDALLAAADE